MKHLIAGNWKMNGTLASAQSLAGALAAKAREAEAEIAKADVAKADVAKADVALCPPAPLLQAVGAAIAGSAIALGAQDCHADDKGAHTGDTSAVLLADLGCRYVIVGHSERRTDHGETDAAVRAKAAAALRAGLHPIICVGETDAERERGETAAVISRQMRGSVPDNATAASSVIAYEPVWAIGTGKTATIADIVAVHRQIRDLFGEAGRDAGPLRILYGGSVKAANAQGILAAEGVTGALVGGASLDAEEFWRIVAACPNPPARKPPLAGKPLRHHMNKLA